MANPFDELRDWIDESEQQQRSRRDRSVVDLMYEGFRLVADVLDDRYSTDPAHYKAVFDLYDAEPARASETNYHGGLLSLGTSDPLDSVPTNIVVSKGTGKILIVLNAGSDVAGSMTVTGTSVDRETGATTPADTDVITVDTLSTDTSSTDANGNTVHGFSDAYITSKWFTGSVTISTGNLTLTDVDTYHVSFEQFDDNPTYTIQTMDSNLFTTGAAAEFDAYLYTLTVSGSKAVVFNQSSLHVGAIGETAIANKYWRLRRGNINKPMDGSTDGCWVDIHYSNTPAQIEDVTLSVWAEMNT